MTRMTDWHRVMLIAMAAIFVGSAVLPLSYSKGVSEWTLYGNITDGATCRPIQGATVSTPFNNNASNITNSTGGYVLRLGYGNWTVTVSKPGYASISFNTPYETSGAFMVNEYLLMPGNVASNCTNSLHSNASTVPSTITASTAPTTVTGTMPSNTASKSSGGGKGGVLAGGIIVAIIIIALAAYFVLGRGKETKEEHKSGHDHGGHAEGHKPEEHKQ